MSCANTFPFVANVLFELTNTSGYLFKILGACTFIVEDFIGTKLFVIPEFTCTCIILLSSPLYFATLLVITFCSKFMHSSAFAYGLTMFIFTVFVAEIAISFCVLSLYVPSIAILFSLLIKPKSNWESVSNCIPTTISFVSPAFIWFK